MNTIGIDRNLDRARIRKLLMIGLFASVLTGIGDFLLSGRDLRLYLAGSGRLPFEHGHPEPGL